MWILTSNSLLLQGYVMQIFVYAHLLRGLMTWPLKVWNTFATGVVQGLLLLPRLWTTAVHGS